MIRIANALIVLINAIIKLLHKPPYPPPLAIPYPEEKPDYTQTMENTNVNIAVSRWLLNYAVPVEYWDYWQNSGVIITLRTDFPYPAWAYEKNKQRYMDIKPEYVNAGVIAHEQAHTSYSLLTRKQKAEFSKEYNAVKDTDPLILLLYSTNPYGLTNDTEAHAELYRYLHLAMPKWLIKYYPRLF